MISDPRLLYQTVSVRHESVTFELATWWSFFADADAEVLRTEVMDVQSFVRCGSIDKTAMVQAQRRRLRSDLRGLLLAFLVAVFVLVCAGFTAVRYVVPLLLPAD